MHLIELFVLTLSGAVYTIWGKKGCPTVTGTKTIYSGIYHFNMYQIFNVLFISRRWRGGGGVVLSQTTSLHVQVRVNKFNINF